MFGKTIFGLKDSNGRYVNYDQWDGIVSFVTGEDVFSYQLWSEEDLKLHLKELNSNLKYIEVSEGIELPLSIAKFYMNITEL